MITEYDDLKVADLDEWISATLSACDDETTVPSTGSSSPAYSFPESNIFDCDRALTSTKRKSASRSSLAKKRCKVASPFSERISSSSQLSTIPVDDIRRTFAISFADLMNLGDPVDISNFLAAHGTDNVEFVMKGKVSSAQSTYVVAHGKAAVVAYFDAYFAAVPDLVFELSTTTIEPIGNRETVITACFELSGRQVLEMVTDHQYTLLAMPTNLGFERNNHHVLALGINPDSGKIDLTMAPSDRLLIDVKPIAKEISLQGKVTFHVNADNKIFSFQWTFLPNRATNKFRKTKQPY